MTIKLPPFMNCIKLYSQKDNGKKLSHITLNNKYIPLISFLFLTFVPN